MEDRQIGIIVSPRWSMGIYSGQIRSLRSSDRSGTHILFLDLMPSTDLMLTHPNDLTAKL